MTNRPGRITPVYFRKSGVYRTKDYVIGSRTTIIPEDVNPLTLVQGQKAQGFFYRQGVFRRPPVWLPPRKVFTGLGTPPGPGIPAELAALLSINWSAVARLNINRPMAILTELEISPTVELGRRSQFRSVTDILLEIIASLEYTPAIYLSSSTALQLNIVAEFARKAAFYSNTFLNLNITSEEFDIDQLINQHKKLEPLSPALEDPDFRTWIERNIALLKDVFDRAPTTTFQTVDGQTITVNSGVIVKISGLSTLEAILSNTELNMTHIVRMARNRELQVSQALEMGISVSTIDQGFNIIENVFTELVLEIDPSLDVSRQNVVLQNLQMQHDVNLRRSIQFDVDVTLDLDIVVDLEVAGQSVITSLPWTVTIEDWTGSTPIPVGTITMNQYAENFVASHPDIAASMGVVEVRQSSESVIWDGFEFGAMCLDAGAHCSESGLNPLYQVLVNCKPHGRWATYPAKDTWVHTTDRTFPSAFKAVLRLGDGTIAHTWEMHGGEAINDPSLLFQVGPQGSRADSPIQPKWNMASILVWQSERPSVSSNADKFHTGMTLESIRPSTAKRGHSSNGAFMMASAAASGRSQQNDSGHLYLAYKWPLHDTNSYTASFPGKGANDPYFSYSSNQYQTPGYYSGWGYEPGAVGTHDHFCGPGGIRFDRCFCPSPMALFRSDPNYVRLKDTVPIRELVDEFGKNYFNWPIFYMRNVKTFESFPHTELIQDGGVEGWSHSIVYYAGGGNLWVPGGNARMVDIRSVTNGDYDGGGIGNYAPPDRRRHYELFDETRARVWNGYSADYLHQHQTPYWWAMIFNSPMHFFASKMFFFQNRMSYLSANNRRLAADTTTLVTRYTAYRLGHLVCAWSCASDNPIFGLPQDFVLQQLVYELEWVNTTFRIPALAEASDQLTALNRFGTRLASSNGHFNPDICWVAPESPLAFYISQVFSLLKTSGCWDAIHAASANAALGLRFIMECHDKYAIDWIVHTDGIYEGGSTPAGPPQPVGTPLSKIHMYANWEEAGVHMPRPGSATWHRTEAGTMTEKYSGQHMRAQWAWMRRDYYPEITRPTLEAACDRYDFFYAEREAAVNAAATPIAKTSADWVYRVPGLGRFNPPSP